jgi:hypothetical protein
MKFILAVLLVSATITAFFGDTQKAIFMMLMIIFIQGQKIIDELLLREASEK